MRSANTLYLDFAATSPLLPEVREKMHQMLDLDLSNPSALHQSGHYAKEVVEEAREHVAQLINADPDEIIFVSGGSEANNTIMNVFAGQSIAVSNIEHPSVLEAAKQRAGKFYSIPVDEFGFVKVNSDDKDKDQNLKDVNLISIMLASNEIGTVQDIAPIIKLAHKNGARFHTDATQVVSKIPIDVKELNVDYLTFSAHKIGGPVGIGVLYVKKGAPYKSLIFGGAQERKRRAGTSNALLAAGFGEAARVTFEQKTWEKYPEVAKLRNYLACCILKEIPYSSINGGLAKFSDKIKTHNPESIITKDLLEFDQFALSNLLNVSFAAAEGESTQLYLDAENILVSTGSACASGDIQPSHVLMATSGDAEVAHGSVRFTLGLDTTKEDIDRLMQVLPGIVKRLQGISTIELGDKNDQ